MEYRIGKHFENQWNKSWFFKKKKKTNEVDRPSVKFNKKREDSNY